MIKNFKDLKTIVLENTCTCMYPRPYTKCLSTDKYAVGISKYKRFTHFQKIKILKLFILQNKVNFMCRYNYHLIWEALWLTCSSWSCLCILCLPPNAGCELGSLTACRPHMLYPWQMAVPCNNAHRSSWWPGAFHGLLPSPRGRYHMGNIYRSKETWN